MSSEASIDEILAHTEWLRFLVRDLVRDRHRADDVLQETLLRAVSRPPRRGGSIKAWLARVARNATIDAWRKERQLTRREQRSDGPRPVPSPADVVARAELHRRVVNAVFELDEPYRATVLARYFEGLDSREIALASDEPAATVRSRLKRGLDRLRRRFEEEDGRAWRASLLPLLFVESAGRSAVAAGAGGVVMAAKAKFVVGALLAVGALTVGTGTYVGITRLSAPEPTAPPPEVATVPVDRAPVGRGTPERPPAGGGESARNPSRGPVRSIRWPAATPRKLEELGKLLAGTRDVRGVVAAGNARMITLRYEGKLGGALDKLSEQAGIRISLASGLEDRLDEHVAFAFEESPLRQALEFIGQFKGLRSHATAEGIEFRSARGTPPKPDLGPSRETWQLAGRELWDEVQVRKQWVSGRALLERRFSLSPTTRIETVDDLYWAMQREVRVPLAVHLPPEAMALPCVDVIREGTVEEILSAALGPIENGRLAATRRGVELLPAGRAVKAEEDARELEDALARLTRFVVETKPGPVFLSDLAALVAEASGLEAHVDERFDAREVELDPRMTCRAALDEVTDAFPRLGYTIVGDILVVLALESPGEK